MKIFTHNFNPRSNSGPNKFTRQLFRTLLKSKQITLTDSQSNADVEFCLIQQQTQKVKPMVLRLDGIYFNSDQNFNQQNEPISFSYNNADAVIFQSGFNKKLTERWFGPHKNSHVVHNAADLEMISKADSNYFDKIFKKDTEVWSCASSWRPHKRLKDNVEYFLEYAPKEAIFAIAGGLHMDEAKEILSKDKRIYALGELDYMSLLSLYKRSKTFVHLSYLDHCPNVVVDAQAAGCHIVCSSSGGTKEIVTKGTIIKEDDWDYSPIRLYDPPVIDYSRSTEIYSHQCKDLKSNIVDCSKKYYNVLKGVSSG